MATSSKLQSPMEALFRSYVNEFLSLIKIALEENHAWASSEAAAGTFDAKSAEPRLLPLKDFPIGFRFDEMRNKLEMRAYPTELMSYMTYSALGKSQTHYVVFQYSPVSFKLASSIGAHAGRSINIEQIFRNGDSRSMLTAFYPESANFLAGATTGVFLSPNSNLDVVVVSELNEAIFNWLRKTLDDVLRGRLEGIRTERILEQAIKLCSVHVPQTRFVSTTFNTEMADRKEGVDAQIFMWEESGGQKIFPVQAKSSFRAVDRHVSEFPNVPVVALEKCPMSISRKELQEALEGVDGATVREWLQAVQTALLAEDLALAAILWQQGKAFSRNRRLELLTWLDELRAEKVLTAWKLDVDVNWPRVPTSNPVGWRLRVTVTGAHGITRDFHVMALPGRMKEFEELRRGSTGFLLTPHPGREERLKLRELVTRLVTPLKLLEKSSQERRRLFIERARDFESKFGQGSKTDRSPVLVNKVRQGESFRQILSPEELAEFQYEAWDLEILAAKRVAEKLLQKQPVLGG